jgi:hypothetical protein
MSERLRELLVELRAITVWDREYMSRKTHDGIEQAAWDARRMRLAEVQQELNELRTAKRPTIQPHRCCFPKGAFRRLA